MNEYYIIKDKKYLSISKENHHIYLSNNMDEAVIFSNERLARNIAYDYGASIELIPK